MTAEYILTVFITFFTVIDPLGLIPMYLPLAEKFPKEKHNQLIVKSTIIACGISTFFLITGKILFFYLKIEFYSLFMVGGVLLFVIGLQMIQGTSKKSEESDDYLHEVNDIAVFPLAIPMLSGPGTIATLLMFVSKNEDPLNYLLIFTVMVITFLITAVVMRFSGSIIKVLGKTGLNIIDRVMGIILCTLAIQFIANAVKSFISSL